MWVLYLGYETLTSLCSPNEDFGRRNKRCHQDFRPTFQWFEAQIEYSRPFQGMRKSWCIFCSSFQHLRLGCIKFFISMQMCMSNSQRVCRAHYTTCWCVCRSHSMYKKLMLPKRRFSKTGQKEGVRFRGTLKGVRSPYLVLPSFCSVFENLRLESMNLLEHATRW